MLKVLKTTAEYYELSLGAPLEVIMQPAYEGFDIEEIKRIGNFKNIYEMNCTTATNLAVPK